VQAVVPRSRQAVAAEWIASHVVNQVFNGDQGQVVHLIVELETGIPGHLPLLVQEVFRHGILVLGPEHPRVRHVAGREHDGKEAPDVSW